MKVLVSRNCGERGAALVFASADKQTVHTAPGVLWPALFTTRRFARTAITADKTAAANGSTNGSTWVLYGFGGQSFVSGPL